MGLLRDDLKKDLGIDPVGGSTPLKGNPNTPVVGDRIIEISSEGIPTFLEYSPAGWSRGDLNSSALDFQDQLQLKDAAGSLIYTNKKDDITRICLTLGFDDTGTVQQPFVTYFNAKEIEHVIQSDDSAEITATSFTTAVVSTADEFISKLYGKIGTIAPVNDVNIKIYSSSIALNNLIMNKTYPVSDFTVDTKFDLTLDPIIGQFTNQTTITVITSSVAFSLKSNAAQSSIWSAVDRQIGTTAEVISYGDDGSGNKQYPAAKGDLITDIITTFTAATDTPDNKNVPGIQNVVVNPFNQKIEFKQADLTDNSDTQISNPASGEILEYDEGIAKWINNEPRLVAALASFNITDYITDWGEAGISYLFANDNSEIVTDTPSIPKEGDIILVFNLNTQFGKTIVLNARTGETINNAASYTIQTERITFFLKKGTDWKFGGENTLVTTLSNKSVTGLSDVSDAGSGEIITDEERAKLALLDSEIDGGDPTGSGPGEIDGGTI